MIKIGMSMSDLLPLIDNIEVQALVPNATNPNYLFLRSSFYGHVYLGEATNSNPRSNPKIYMINIACVDNIKPFELENVSVNDGTNHPLDQQSK